jgi:hypothetical protein
MLRTSSFFGPLNSGFVPFSSAAPVEGVAEPAVDPAEGAEAQAAEAVARAAAAPVRQPLVHTVEPWAPASSARIRFVEGAVLVAICGYFGFGLLSALVAM